MNRRALLATAAGICGFLLGAMAAYVALSVQLGAAINSVTNRPTRDRWGFIGALVGLAVGAVLGWWRADEIDG